jgi:hypothetical protein
MLCRLPEKLGIAILIASCICFSACGGVSTSTVNNGPTTVAYVWGSNYPTFDGGTAQTIQEFSTVSPNSTSPIATLTLPVSCDGGPLVTDSQGQLYVACFSPSSAPSILVFPPNPNGTVTPLRTIVLSGAYYEIRTLAIGPNDQLYVGALQNSGVNDVLYAVLIYAQGVSGLAVPLHTIQMPSNNVLMDTAVDGTGNIYAATYPLAPGAGSVSYVYIYSLNGTPTPISYIGSSFFIYGVAVDNSGNIFITTRTGSGNGFPVIEEFTLASTGYESLVNTVNLTSLPDLPGSELGSGPVRVDGAGNVFTALYSGSYSNFNYALYGLSSTSDENDSPIVQSTHNSYNNSFALH